MQEVTPDEARVIASAIHEAANAASFAEIERPEWYHRPMQYLILEARTHPEPLDEGHLVEDCGVHCWIRDQTQTNAYHVSTGWTNEAGWIVIRVIENRDVVEATRLLRYEDQALIDGQVLNVKVSAV